MKLHLLNAGILCLPDYCRTCCPVFGQIVYAPQHFADRTHLRHQIYATLRQTAAQCPSKHNTQRKTNNSPHSDLPGFFLSLSLSQFSKFTQKDRNGPNHPNWLPCECKPFGTSGQLKRGCCCNDSNDNSDKNLNNFYCVSVSSAQQQPHQQKRCNVRQFRICPLCYVVRMCIQFK